MRYQELKAALISHYSGKGRHIMPYISGSPGLGKTSLAVDVGRTLGYEDEHIVIWRGSLRDPVDLLGTPDNRGETTRWKKPDELAKLEKGKWLLLLDELSDCVTMMQNGLCGLVLDRQVGELKLSDDVVLLATGNRVEDKSGAQRIMSKLSNRMMNLTMDANLDDWKDWARLAGVPRIIISFLTYRPGHLCSFDPARASNPTPRSWDFVSKLDLTLPRNLLLAMLSGYVGEGIATEFISFAELEAKLVHPDAIIKDPLNAAVPPDEMSKYVVCGALAEKANSKTFDAISQYVARMPAEYGVLTVRESIRYDKSVTSTKSFRDWLVKNQNVII